MTLRSSAPRFDPSAQNVYWTLALGVLAMAGLKRFEKKTACPAGRGFVWAGCAALALAANTDYHAIGVLIICALYLTRADRKRQCLAGALLFCSGAHRPLAFVLVWFYNGQRGACSPLQKKRPFTGSTRCTCWCWPASRTCCCKSFSGSAGSPCKTIGNALRVALGIFSGKIIL